MAREVLEMSEDASYEELADLAESASEELNIRQGRAEADDRPLLDSTDQELQEWAHWDPEQDQRVIEDLGGGITLRKPKSRSTARRRLKAEPEGEMSDEAKAAPEEPRQPPTPPKRARKRSSGLIPRIPLGAGLAQIVGALGVGLAMSGRDPAVGMALQFEAPIAGLKLDRAIEGTILDSFAQPLARAGKVGKDAGSVLALPILVGLIERRPELYPILKEPLLRPLVVEMAMELEEAGQQAAARLRAAQKKGSGMLIDSDRLLAQLFEGRPPEMPDGEQPS